MIVKEKPRHIFYAGHIDGYIYSFYSKILQRRYDDLFIAANGLEHNAIAYRSIKEKGVGYCNYHFAKDAFDFVKAHPHCNIVCFDLSKFFDRMNTSILKTNWAALLSEKKLPPDHHQVFQSIIDFRYIEEADLIDAFRKRFEKNPRAHGHGKGASLKIRICDFKELRNLQNEFKSEGKKLLKRKCVLEMTGVPQGTAISGLLSNIYMMNFDIALKAFIEGFNGCYKRYSDDIFIAVPISISFEHIEDFVRTALKNHCSESVALNDDKTEKRTFSINSDGKGKVIDGAGKLSKIQYLGFHFDGNNIHIRNSSISKDRAKIVQAVKKHKKEKSINTVKVYKERSSRTVTVHDKQADKGFVSYAKRASKALEGSAIDQQIKKNDRFIKRSIIRLKPRTQ